MLLIKQRTLHLMKQRMQCSNDIDKALERYPNKLIITLGDKGAMYHNGTEKVQIDGFKRELKIQQVLEIHSMVLSQ